VRREALPEPDAGHYYLADLVGLEVVNEQGVPLGVVQRWLFNGAQDVMEVRGEKTRLIPWVASVVRDVDVGKRQIHIEWGADW
jgi:16S rRNA processing protein RimM